MSDWYAKSFGEDYLRVYAHRTVQSAEREMRGLQKILALREGEHVLDFCCGNGRHSLSLADMGCVVTGFDLSEVLLRTARENDQEARVRWVQGDARAVPIEEKFDVLVNLFTSFGYFHTDAEHLQVLSEMRRLLSENGRWVIDFLNASRVQKTLVETSERDLDGLKIKERRWIADGRVNKEILVQDEQEQTRTYLESVRLYELADMQRLCQQAGLKLERVYGDFDGAAFDQERSPRLILVGKVQGDA